jgi:hypothetical protein
MTWLRNLPVSRKFTYAFGSVCGLCIVLGAYTFIAFHGIAAKSADVSDNSFPSVLALADIQGSQPTPCGARIWNCCSASRRPARPIMARSDNRP